MLWVKSHTAVAARGPHVTVPSEQQSESRTWGGVATKKCLSGLQLGSGLQGCPLKALTPPHAAASSRGPCWAPEVGLSADWDPRRGLALRPLTACQAPQPCPVVCMHPHPCLPPALGADLHRSPILMPPPSRHRLLPRPSSQLLPPGDHLPEDPNGNGSPCSVPGATVCSELLGALFPAVRGYELHVCSSKGFGSQLPACCLPSSFEHVLEAVRPLLSIMPTSHKQSPALPVF